MLEFRFFTAFLADVLVDFFYLFLGIGQFAFEFAQPVEGVLVDVQEIGPLSAQ